MGQFFQNVTVLLTLCFSLLFSQANAQSNGQPRHTFDPIKTREILLQLAEKVPQEKTVISPAAAPGSKQEAFLNYYLKEILPVSLILAKVSNEYSAYHILTDAALYNSPEERDAWKAKMLQAIATDDSYSSNPEWEAKQIELARLAEGLTGELADHARLVAKRLQFSQYPASAESLLREQAELGQEVNQVANTSPYLPVMQTTEAKLQELKIKYFKNEISYFDGAAQAEKLGQEGFYTYGEDVINKAGPAINRMAQIKTELAKIKGFATHTDFVLASQADGHDPRLQGKQNLLKFLYGLLDATESTTREYLEKRAMQVAGKPLSQLRPSQVSFLNLNPQLSVAQYFPAKDMVDVWLTSMKESGFTDDHLQQVIVDAYPRANKYGHAYMSPLVMPKVNELQVDGQSLNIKETTDWESGLVYIMQNFTKDGIDDLRTGFHEGGHALDYTSQRDPLGQPTAYGFVETHSMTMEYFNLDKEFLLAHGKTKEGSPITEEIVDRYIAQTAESDMLGFRFNVGQAIFDIELWDYDYSTGSKTFVERALELSEKIARKVSFISQPADLKPNGYLRFTTGHFRSGAVRYYGYVLADMAAASVANKLLDHFEQTTGRRSLYNQPTLSKLLIEGLYAKGMMKPFPQQIEDFTGHTYSPQDFTQELNSRLKELGGTIDPTRCNDLL